jgi:hypothetical protein
MSQPLPVPAPAPAITMALILVHPAINTPQAVRELEQLTGSTVVIRKQTLVLKQEPRP